MPSARHRRSVIAGLTVACAVVVGACGSDEPPPSAADSTETAETTEPTTPPSSSPSAETVTTASVGIVAVYDSVEFYPACGNEILDHEGTTWYPLVHSGFNPFDPDLQGRIDDVFAVQRQESPVTGVRGLVRVPAPGPGDDIGTLVVWEDGVARWVSESRDLDVWMIDDEIVYSWEC